MTISISEIRALTTSLSDLLKKGMTLEAQEKVMELREVILALREELVTVKEENLTLRQAAKVSDELTWDGRLYWRKTADGKSEGPFCPRCKDDRDRVSRMTKTAPVEGIGGWGCVSCDYVSYDDE